MSATLIQSLLKDDKSKVATLIAAGASACALIYYNQEIRNQIANIFMVRLFYLLFPFFSLSFSLSLSGFSRVKRSIFSRIGPHPRVIFSISQIDATRGWERERERREMEKRTRDWGVGFSPPSSPFSNRNKFLLRASFFFSPRDDWFTLLSLSLSLSFSFETIVNARADQCFLVIIIIIIAFTRTYSYT